MDPGYFFLRPETSGLQKKFWDDNSDRKQRISSGIAALFYYSKMSNQ